MTQDEIAAGGKISLQSDNYILRTMEAADADLDWGGWLANPATARRLNAAPRTMSVDERRAYIARSDSRQQHLLGIFERETGAFVGFWSIYVNEERKEFLLNVIVGSNDGRHKGALKETRYLVHEHFFDQLGMNAARCSVTSRNEEMIAFLKANRWTEVAVDAKASPEGGQVAIHHFVLPRAVWSERRAALS